MKFGIEFVPQKPLEEILAEAKKAEESGFEYCWVTDHYNNRNVYEFLTVIAQETKEMMLGPGVTNPYLIHPAVAASAGATLDEVSGGRVIMGVSAGDKTVLSSLGVEITRLLPTMTESIEIIRRLTRGERLDYDGKIFKLKGVSLNFKAKHDIPVYMGAQGPMMLELAGKISDGVLINASHPEDIAYSIKQVEKGVKKSGRKMKDFDVAAYTSFSIADKKEEAEEEAKIITAFIAAAAPSIMLERHEIPSSEAEAISKLIKRGDFGAAIKGVTQKMLDAFGIYGTPDECLDKVKALKKTGVTQLVVGSPIGPKPLVAIDTIREKIVPNVG